MPVVDYRFFARPEYSTVTFDGLYITLNELKKQIMSQEFLEAPDYDLQITNEQTCEVYTGDEAQIPELSSVMVKPTAKTFIVHRVSKAAVISPTPTDSPPSLSIAQLAKMANLYDANASEDDKIEAMMLQSNFYYASIKEAFAQGKKEHPPFVPHDQSSPEDDSGPIPHELMCPICNDLMTNAVVIPCCGYSYCELCIRMALLHPCQHADVSPGALIPNNLLRQRVNNYKNAKASEDDKIEPMKFQPYLDDASMNFPEKAVGSPPANYICYCCGKAGHYIRECPMLLDKSVEVPKPVGISEGIPQSFMVKADPGTEGAMLTSSGEYAIPAIDAEAFAQGKKEHPPFVPDDQSSPEDDSGPIPHDLMCPICNDLMTNAVVIPCCGYSYCELCIRMALLHPCQHADVSPGALIPNNFLRQLVNIYKNETSNTKLIRQQAQQAALPPPRLQISRQQDPLLANVTPPPPANVPTAAPQSQVQPPAPSPPAPVPAPVSAAATATTTATAAAPIPPHAAAVEGQDVSPAPAPVADLHSPMHSTGQGEPPPPGEMDPEPTVGRSPESNPGIGPHGYHLSYQYPPPPQPHPHPHTSGFIPPPPIGDPTPPQPHPHPHTSGFIPPHPIGDPTPPQPHPHPHTSGFIPPPPQPHPHPHTSGFIPPHPIGDPTPPQPHPHPHTSGFIPPRPIGDPTPPQPQPHPHTSGFIPPRPIGDPTPPQPHPHPHTSGFIPPPPIGDPTPPQPHPHPHTSGFIPPPPIGDPTPPQPHPHPHTSGFIPPPPIGDPTPPQPHPHPHTSGFIPPPPIGDPTPPQPHPHPYTSGFIPPPPIGYPPPPQPYPPSYTFGFIFLPPFGYPPQPIYAPGPPGLNPPLIPPGVQPPLPHLGPPLSQPPLSKEYCDRRRHRQDKTISKLDEFTKEFQRELMKHKHSPKRQKKSYSRSQPFGRSQYTRSGARSRSRSYSCSPSRSRSRSHSHGRSYPRSPYSRHNGRSYRRSRSRSHSPLRFPPPFRAGPWEGAEGPAPFRSRSRSPGGFRNRSPGGRKPPPRGRPPYELKGPSPGGHDRWERERYRRWEKEYTDLYNKYCKDYDNQHPSLHHRGRGSRDRERDRMSRLPRDYSPQGRGKRGRDERGAPPQHPPSSSSSGTKSSTKILKTKKVNKKRSREKSEPSYHSADSDCGTPLRDEPMETTTHPGPSLIKPGKKRLRK